MQTPLSVLPVTLLQTLGRSFAQRVLAHRLAPLYPSAQPGFQYPRGDAYYLGAAPGLDLVLQRIKLGAAEAEHQWGLHSFTLQARSWAGQWPEGMDPHTATAEDVAKLFALDAETAMVTPAMVCFVIPGLVQDQQWSVLCTFGYSSRTLESFSLLRVGEWLSGESASAV